MVAKDLFIYKFLKYFSITFDERRLERLIIELRNIVPVVKGRRDTDVTLLSPSGHIADNIGFLLLNNKRLKSSNNVSRFLSKNPSTE